MFKGGNNEGQFDYFGNAIPTSQSINTFSASSTGSSKSTNSSVVTSASSNSFNQQSNQVSLNQQKPIGTSQSCYDISSTSTISISTDN